MLPTLLLIDVQRGFDEPHWGPRNNPRAEANIARLLAAWRKESWPVVHVQHMSRESGSPLRPDRPGNAFKPEAAPRVGEPVFQKSVNSAFIGTKLEAFLLEDGVTDLVCAGIATDHCVSTTVRMAANLGFRVQVVEDACATFDRVGAGGSTYAAEDVHRYALASLRGEFAEVVTTDGVLAAMSTGTAG
jgi:nicotinamidase-related amidase